MFDLNQASEGRENTGINYQTPGIFDNVRVSEVVLEKTIKNSVPYMRLITDSPEGTTGTSAKMFLSTDVKTNPDGSPKKTSGWGVTARNLVDLLKATHNVDEETAKGLISGITTPDALVKKVSALLVGKPFRAKFGGETSSKGYIFAVIRQVESMKVEPTKMKFNKEWDVKPYTGVTSTDSTEAVNSTSENNDINSLPF